LTADRFSRRDFGRLAGAAGAAAVLAARPGTARAVRTARAGVAPAAVRTAAGAGDRGLWRVTGPILRGLEDFDDTVMSFMRERSIPCGSLAVARAGRLLLARGYSWGARAPRDAGPASLFRTASISKPVTATAVLRLIQDGRLRPSDRMTDLLRVGTPADPRLGQVTVSRLLRHLGGWDREVSGDPMFDDAAIAEALGRPLPISQDDIVRYVTARPLDHAPGTAFAYSNYGYLLLGRIIERVTGRPYAAYVRDAVLAPLGITRMRLGRTLMPAAGEVPYYSQYKGTTVMDPSGAQVAAPYGTFNQENNAFNCGWLATAVDLVRLARVYDGVTPVLSAGTVAQALAVPETGATRGRYYACGWHVRQTDRGLVTWHSGSLPGTHTLLVRRFDGLTWAVMFDQRDDPSGEPYRDIDTALHDTADDMPDWPSGDVTGTRL
jgi:CubicO group peptidase (beta-lactamase class C family)